MKPRHTLAVVAITLVGCSSQVLPAATPTTHSAALRLYVTTPALPLINALTTSYNRINPGVSFEIATGEYQTMVEAVMRDEESYLLTDHLPPEEDVPLLALPIGQDGIAVIVHPENPVTTLTTAELRDIYRGWIDNWNEVGGRNAAIVVYTRERGSGTREEFTTRVMGNRRTTPTAQIAPSNEAMVISVARDPGGIGYVSMSYLDERVRPVSVDDIPLTVDTVYDHSYPLRSILYFAGLKEPQEHFRAFIAWVQSPDGQAVVAQVHAPLLRSR